MGNLHVSQGDTDLVVPCDAPVMPLPHLVEVDAQFELQVIAEAPFYLLH